MVYVTGVYRLGETWVKRFELSQAVLEGGSVVGSAQVGEMGGLEGGV